MLSWDSKVSGIKILISEATGKYIDDVISMCDNVLYEFIRSPKGLTFIDKLGSLKHTSNAAFVCLMVRFINDFQTQDSYLIRIKTRGVVCPSITDLFKFYNLYAMPNHIF